MMASPRIMPAVNVLFTQVVSVLNGSECVRLGGIASIAKAVPLVSSEIEYVKASVIIDPRKPTHGLHRGGQECLSHKCLKKIGAGQELSRFMRGSYTSTTSGNVTGTVALDRICLGHEDERERQPYKFHLEFCCEYSASDGDMMSTGEIMAHATERGNQIDFVAHLEALLTTITSTSTLGHCSRLLQMQVTRQSIRSTIEA